MSDDVVRGVYAWEMSDGSVRRVRLPILDGGGMNAPEYSTITIDRAAQGNHTFTLNGNALNTTGPIPMPRIPPPKRNRKERRRILALARCA